MIEYKGYFMSGAALMIHPNSPDWRAIGTVRAKTPQGSILEVESIGGPVFTSKEAAEKHALVLCQAWIEEKLQQVEEHGRSIPCNSRSLNCCRMESKDINVEIAIA